MIFAVGSRYEKELTYLGNFISPGMVVVDGGANCGIYSVAAARLAGPGGLVLAFEPGAETFSVLKRNVEMNRLTNVRSYCAALSDKDGRARLYQHADGPNSFSLGPSENAIIESKEVVTRTLDGVLGEVGVDRTGLIKLDVEGAEELVLRGAKKVIANSHPTIIFEVNAGAAKRLGLSASGAWELLRSWSYRFFFLTESGNLRELKQPPAADDILNVIAVHSRRWE